MIKMKNIKAIFRRGPTQQPSLFKGEVSQSGELSRASSVSNLDNKGGGSSSSSVKGAFSKLKKTASKDKLDNSGEKRLNKNNNKATDSNSPQDLDILHRQLAQMADEKSILTLELDAHNGEMSALRQEVAKLNVYKDSSTLQLEQLKEENTILRNRLRDVSYSPLSDTEKQQLLDTHRHHNSAPASIATAYDGADTGQACAASSDWDKHSSSNVSDVSVACLQDKINQMQETHYSTNEELQATLQELTDLQRQLGELQIENDRLSDEKNLMFDSLCRQTERLTDSRAEVDSLKQLLCRDKDDGQLESVVDREQRLVELLKSAQEERESLLLKLEQLNLELQESRHTNLIQANEIKHLGDRVGTLESTLDAKHAEHRQLDQELALAKDQSSGRHIEINRLAQLLENARTKIFALEQDRVMRDKSELDEMLDTERKERDALESEVTNLKEQIARTTVDKEKLKEKVSVLQEECKVIRNNAKCTQSELEYKCEKMKAEKTGFGEQLQRLQETACELQMQAQCQAEDKRQLASVLSETQRHLNEAEHRINELEKELLEIKSLRDSENSEWEKFQNDLLTSVRVANDFKTEAQQDLQNMIMENKGQRDRVKLLEAQIDKLKVVTAPSSEPIQIRPSSFSGEDVTTRRQNITMSRPNSRQSVKSLIESIENASKPSKSLLSGSQSSSTSSLNSFTSDLLRTPDSPTGIGHNSLSPLRNDWSSDLLKGPLREQQPNKQTREWSKSILLESRSKTVIDSTKTSSDMLQHSSSKPIDYARRNSYSDMSERKDPLNGLVKNGGSKRNALLKWCQNKTIGYRNIDITNFSSSWNDGLALCAVLHTYLPDRVPYDTLTPQEKRRNFSVAFLAAESVGIPTTLNINDMIHLERPDWQQVMSYVTSIYKHFEF